MMTPERTSSDADQFYDRALERIRKFMLTLAALGLLACIALFRWQVAVGFAAGATISYVNHRWLERAIGAIGERIASGQSRERGTGIIVRVVLRYIFVAVGAYVIFNISRAGVYGFLGVFVFPLQPWPAKSRWNCSLQRAKGFDFPVYLVPASAPAESAQVRCQK